MAKPTKPRKDSGGTPSPMDKSVDEIEAYINQWQSRLFNLWKVVFKKVAAKLKSTVFFVSRVLKETGKIVSTVGKKVVETMQRSVSFIEDTLKRTPMLIKMALRFGSKIIAVIRKGMEPKKLAGTLKRMVTRYANMVRRIATSVTDFLKEIDVLGGVLSIVNAFKTALSFIVPWILEVASVSSAIRKVSSLLRKVVKLMKTEVRDAVKMSKKASRLKPA